MHVGVCANAWCATESIFKTDNSYGRVSHGLFKTCLLSDSQGYVPTGCYDYGSGYGKILSNDCQIFDGEFPPCVGGCPDADALQLAAWHLCACAVVNTRGGCVHVCLLVLFVCARSGSGWPHGTFLN